MNAYMGMIKSKCRRQDSKLFIWRVWLKDTECATYISNYLPMTTKSANYQGRDNQTRISEGWNFEYYDGQRTEKIPMKNMTQLVFKKYNASAHSLSALYTNNSMRYM